MCGGLHCNTDGHDFLYDDSVDDDGSDVDVFYDDNNCVVGCIATLTVMMIFFIMIVLMMMAVMLLFFMMMMIVCGLHCNIEGGS